MKDFELFILANGIRIVHKEVNNTKVVHCGFILDVGSRDEDPDQQGIAHFWEHMVFKGTHKRKAFHILNRLDSVGGELNAYTSKEKICFYASVLNNYFEKALELLTDITFDSVFPEKQIEREKNVILEEMAMYRDSPEDAIQDEFDKLVFADHPLGNNILGTTDSVRSFHRSDFQNFIYKNIDTERIIFSCVGNITFHKVLKLAEKHLKQIPSFRTTRERLPFLHYAPKRYTIRRDLVQTHCAVGKTACALSDERHLPFFMLTNLLGGPSLNSRLNLALREKYGFVYAIEASYVPYTETGLFGIFFGTEPKQLNKSIQLVLKEIKRIKDTPLGAIQLHRTKEQLMGQLAMAEENNAGLMLMMGKSLLDLDRIDNLKTIFDKIRRITAKRLQDIANDLLDETQLSYLSLTSV